MATTTRQPYLIVACGKKASGKTFTTTQMINEVVRGNAQTGAKPRKVLILDVNGEFTMYKTMPLQYVSTFSSSKTAEVRRITIFKDDGKKMTLNEIADTLKYILDNYKNGLLLVEDITRYISDSLPNDLIGAICTQRHMGVDIVLHFQMLGKAGHPKIMANMNMMRLHKVSDPADKHKKKFEDYFPLVKISQLIIDLEYSKREKSKFWDAKTKKVYFFVYIDIDKEHIIGAFDKQMFAAAVHEYMNEEERSTIGLYIRKKNDNGELLYDYKTAYKQVQADFLDKYYGNAK